MSDIDVEPDPLQLLLEQALKNLQENPNEATLGLIEDTSEEIAKAVVEWLSSLVIKTDQDATTKLVNSVTVGDPP